MQVYMLRKLCMHVNVYVYVYDCMHTSIHAYIQINIHTYASVYIYIYTQTPSCFTRLCLLEARRIRHKPLEEEEEEYTQITYMCTLTYTSMYIYICVYIYILETSGPKRLVAGLC